MNDFFELESDLKKLRPARTSPELMTAIERSLALESEVTPTAGLLPRSRKFRVNWIPLGLGVAAAAGFLILARLEVNEAPQKQPALAAISPVPARVAQNTAAGDLLPSGMTRVVYNRQDEGLHFTEGARRPVRRVRTETQETLHWRNPSTGASLRVSYPREEVTLIPVSGQ